MLSLPVVAVVEQVIMVVVEVLVDI